MTAEDWVARMRRELVRRAVPAETIEQVAREAWTHVRESGQEPMDAFGLPEVYAKEVAGSLIEYVGPVATTQRGPARITAHGLGKRYGRRWVWTGLDFTVHAGQVTAVVGANGSGKSTLLRICAGLAAPDQGRIDVEGTIGFCPQYGGTLDFLHPDEHFALVGAGRGMTRRQAVQEGRRLAAGLQWNAEEQVQARHLSGGTRQKLNLALASLGDPDILLLDEPYQGFDQGSFLDFWHQVWLARDHGKAVMVVTHLLEQLDRVDSVLDLTSAGWSA